jgi:hypothetical protein
MTAVEDEPSAGDESERTPGEASDVKSRGIRMLAALKLAFLISWEIAVLIIPNPFRNDIDRIRRQANRKTRVSLVQWGRVWRSLAPELAALDTDMVALRRKYRRCAWACARQLEKNLRRRAYYPIINGLVVILGSSAVFLYFFNGDWHGESLFVQPLLLWCILVASLVSQVFFVGFIFLMPPKRAFVAYASLAVGQVLLAYFLLPDEVRLDRQRLRAVIGGLDDLLPSCLLILGLIEILTLGSFILVFALAALLDRSDVPARTRLVSEMVMLVGLLPSSTIPVGHARRQQAVLHLHRAAEILRVDFPKSIVLMDPNHKRIFAERCDRAAVALDSMQLWIALPKADTRPQIMSVIAQMLSSILRGAYDELPQPDLPLASPVQRFVQIGRSVKVILVGAVPILVLVGLRQVDVRVEGVFGNAITGFCVAWALVAYLSMLDPQLPQRLTMIRDFVSTVKAIKGGDESKK